GGSSAPGGRRAAGRGWRCSPPDRGGGGDAPAARARPGWARASPRSRRRRRWGSAPRRMGRTMGEKVQPCVGSLNKPSMPAPSPFSNSGPTILKTRSEKSEDKTVSKVLVTGGAGFIGSHLVDRLVAAGNDLRILDT